jgi:hypothetical protein
MNDEEIAFFKRVYPGCKIRFHSEVCIQSNSHIWETCGNACGTIDEIIGAPEHTRLEWREERKKAGYLFSPVPQAEPVENVFAKAKKIMQEIGYDKDQINQLLVEFAEARVIKN